MSTTWFILNCRLQILYWPQQGDGLDICVENQGVDGSGQAHNGWQHGEHVPGLQGELHHLLILPGGDGHLLHPCGQRVSYDNSDTDMSMATSPQVFIP